MAVPNNLVLPLRLQTYSTCVQDTIKDLKKQTTARVPSMQQLINRVLNGNNGNGGLLSELDKLKESYTNFFNEVFPDISGATLPEKEKRLQSQLAKLQKITSVLNGIDFDREFGSYLATTPAHTNDDAALSSKLRAIEVYYTQQFGDRTMKEIASIINQDIHAAFDKTTKGGKRWSEKNYGGAMYRVLRDNNDSTFSIRAINTVTKDVSKWINGFVKHMPASLPKDDELAQARWSTIVKEATDANFAITTDIDFFSYATSTNATYSKNKQNERRFNPDSDLIDQAANYLVKMLENRVSITDEVQKDKFNKACEQIILSAEGKSKLQGGANAVKQYKGLLGEIQSLFYMYVLLGDNANVYWQGGKLINSVQPHNDLMVEIADSINGTFKGYGIQIKNYSKLPTEANSEVMRYKDIEFQSFSTSTSKSILKELNPDADEYDSFRLKFPEMFNDIFDHDSIAMRYIWQVRAMQSFNVPYRRNDTDTFKQVEIQEFTDNKATRWEKAFRKSYNKLHSAEIDYITHTLINKYIEKLMFIQKCASVSTITDTIPNNNILYIIGGIDVVSGYDIIAKVVSDLGEAIKKWHGSKSSTSWSFDMYSSENSQTIVDYMNESIAKARISNKIDDALNLRFKNNFYKPMQLVSAFNFNI